MEVLELWRPNERRRALFVTANYRSPVSPCFFLVESALSVGKLVETLRAFTQLPTWLGQREAHDVGCTVWYITSLRISLSEGKANLRSNKGIALCGKRDTTPHYITVTNYP